MDAGTQGPTHTQGNGSHQRQAAGVCAKHKQTGAHTLQKGYKPEITIKRACKLDITLFPSLHFDWGITGMSSGCLSLVPGSFNPSLQRGFSWLGDPLWWAWSSWDTGGGKRVGSRGDGYTEQSRFGIDHCLEEREREVT